MKLALAALMLAVGAHAQCPYGIKPIKPGMAECLPASQFAHWREVLRDGNGPRIVTYSDGKNVMVCNEAAREGYRTQAISTACVLLPRSNTR